MKKNVNQNECIYFPIKPVSWLLSARRAEAMQGQLGVEAQT
jgi:hypothetical protein